MIRNYRVPYLLSGGPWFSISALFAFFSLQEKFKPVIWLQTPRGREGQTFIFLPGVHAADRTGCASRFTPQHHHSDLDPLLGSAWRTAEKQYIALASLFIAMDGEKPLLDIL